MQAVNLQTAAATSAKSKSEPAKFAKRIGSTTFLVSVRFSETATETVEDKILRMIGSEVKNVA
ncbi:hypothetical protein FACS18949_01740 [Clostridia bacterium]|nr:hypothetical protein FACS189425_09840 [Clostridia bacterium]GHV32002.1 hypothetical protein FACS18949_01740 [Clostridia bacterium]